MFGASLSTPVGAGSKRALGAASSAAEPTRKAARTERSSCIGSNSLEELLSTLEESVAAVAEVRVSAFSGAQQQRVKAIAFQLARQQRAFDCARKERLAAAVTEVVLPIDLLTSSMLHLSATDLAFAAQCCRHFRLAAGRAVQERVQRMRVTLDPHIKVCSELLDQLEVEVKKAPALLLRLQDDQSRKTLYSYTAAVIGLHVDGLVANLRMPDDQSRERRNQIRDVLRMLRRWSSQSQTQRTRLLNPSTLTSQEEWLTTHSSLFFSFLSHREWLIRITALSVVCNLPPVAFEKGGTLALLPFLTDTDTRPGANPYDDMRIDVLRKCKELPLSTLPPLREAIEAISRDRGSDSGLHQARNKEARSLARELRLLLEKRDASLHISEVKAERLGQA